MPHPGQLLLAEPFLLDPNFSRSGVVLVDVHDEGTVGFVLTQPLDVKLPKLLRDFPDFDATVSTGGPVQQDTLHFIHTLGDVIENSLPIVENLCWGGDFEHLTLLIAEGIADAGNVRFFLGYSGWSPGQLEAEIEEKTWVTADLTNDLIFSTPPDQVWSRSMKRLGSVYAVIGAMDQEPLN